MTVPADEAQLPLAQFTAAKFYANRLDNFVMAFAAALVGQKGAKLSESTLRTAVDTAQRALEIIDNVGL